MSTCGSVVTSSITDLPAMSRPSPDPERGLGLGRLGRAEHVAEGDDDALLVGHFDAHRAATGDRRQDAHVERRHGVLDVVAQAGDAVDLHARAELELVAGDGGADGGADQPGLHTVVRQRGLEHAPGVVDQAAVGFPAAPPLQHGGGREPPRTASTRLVRRALVVERDDELAARVLDDGDLDRDVGRGWERCGLQLGLGRGFGLLVVAVLELRVVEGRGTGVRRRCVEVDPLADGRELHRVPGLGCGDARRADGGADDHPDREPEHEQHTDQRHRTEGERRTDDADGGDERSGDHGAERAAGVAEVVDVTAERRATVREVEDADVGDEEEQRADGDAQRRRFGRSFVVGDSPRIKVGAIGVDRRRPPGPEQHDPEGEARHRHRDPGPAQDRAGAVGQRRAHRTGELGPQPEGEDRPQHEEAHGEQVSPVAGQLPARRLPRARHHPRLRRRRLGPRPGGCAGSRLAGRLLLGPGRRATPRLGRGHLPKVTPPHRPQEHSPTTESDRPAGTPRSLDREGQTSMTTGMIAGRRLVRSLMNLPRERRQWRRRVSKSVAPSSAASLSDASTAALASSSSSSASGA